VRGLAFLALALAALLASVAAAKTPLPSSPQGSGAEPTAGAGIVAGAPFKVRAALAQIGSFDDIEVYLFSKPVACSEVYFADPPYVKAHVHTEGTPLLVGKPSLQNGRDFVQVDFHPKGPKYYAIQPGASVTFTRVDARKTGVWHGRITVKRQRFEGKLFAYEGTFAARWCGRG
jgi:hypothetical protein